MNEVWKNHQKKIQKKNAFKTMPMKDLDRMIQKKHNDVMELTAKEVK